jgi:hypothetical protein
MLQAAGTLHNAPCKATTKHVGDSISGNLSAAASADAGTRSGGGLMHVPKVRPLLDALRTSALQPL